MLTTFCQTLTSMFIKSLGLYEVNEWLQRGPIIHSNFDWIVKFDSYVKQGNRKFHNQIFVQTYFATKENHTILIKSSNNFDQFLCLLWLVFSALILRKILMQRTLNMNDNGVFRSAYNSVVKTQFNKLMWKINAMFYILVPLKSFLIKSVENLNDLWL